MKRHAFSMIRLAAAFFLLASALWGCDYARMNDDEAYQSYQEPLPDMPEKVIPTTGGSWVLRRMNPDDIKNPISPGPETAALGAQRYGFYCIHCHGPKGSGNGTVGQSFAPGPADLTSSQVQNQSDGQLFYKISFGYKRHPALANTASDEERWAVIGYLRALAGKS
jgi:mono/diheme cytochrome c family protein